MIPQLLTADVNNIGCRFSSLLNDYLLCLKYDTNCCLCSAKSAYLDYKLSSLPCTLQDSTICELKKSSNKKNYVSTCVSSVSCPQQSTCSITTSTLSSTYKSSFSASPQSLTLSAQMPITLVPNSIYHKGYLTAGVLLSNNLSNTYQVSTGKALVGGVVSSSPTLDMSAKTQLTLIGVNNLSTGFIQTIRLYYTNSSGQFVASNFWDINVSPTSPYLTCGSGCTVVNPLDLYFSATNFTTALANVIKNAIQVLTSGINIDVSVSKLNGTSNLRIATTIKHLPSSV
jgi:hypothetical protein